MAGLCGGSRCGCAITGGAITGSGTPADPYVVANAAGVMGYAQVTANQTGITTSVTDLTGLTVTFTAVAGRRYRVTVQGAAGASNRPLAPYLREGSTTLFGPGQVWDGDTLTSGPALIWVSNGSISGAKTWKASVTSPNGADGSLRASATQPAFILVEDIGEL